MKSPESRRFTPTYFREYGIHSVTNGTSTDHIVSYPNWEETEKALEDNLPQSGRIITPEYATAPQDFENLTQSPGLIRARIERAKELSRHTDAELYLGTPYFLGQKNTWHNSVLTLRGGNMTGITHKTTVLPVEKRAGIEPYPDRNRRIRDGHAVLICAELYDFAYTASKEFKDRTEDLIVPASWATPTEDFNEFRESAISRAGGADSYYRQLLETAAGDYAMTDLPNVNRITVVDRGQPDLPPYNAVFERITAEDKKAA